MATAIEYGLVSALVAVAAVGITDATKNEIVRTHNTVNAVKSSPLVKMNAAAICGADLMKLQKVRLANNEMMTYVVSKVICDGVAAEMVVAVSGFGSQEVSVRTTGGRPAEVRPMSLIGRLAM